MLLCLWYSQPLMRSAQQRQPLGMTIRAAIKWYLPGALILALLTWGAYKHPPTAQQQGCDPKYAFCPD